MNRGILYMIIAGLAFMIVNFFVKILGSNQPNDYFGYLQHYPAHELVLARSIVSLAISYYIIKRRGLPVLGNNKKWLLIRGASGAIALTIFFYTIQNLPLVLASILQYLSPIFTVILGIILLKDRVRWMQWLFILMAFAGVGIIAFEKLLSSAEAPPFDLFWVGLAIISAAFSGLAYTAIVKLKSTDTAINIVFYFPLLSTPIMLIWSAFEFTMPQGVEWLILLCIGIFTQIAQVMMTKAFHAGPTSVVAPFQYLGAIYAFLLGFFVFDESLTLYGYLGAFVILAGILLNSRYRKA